MTINPAVALSIDVFVNTINNMGAALKVSLGSLITQCFHLTALGFSNYKTISNK